MLFELEVGESIDGLSGNRASLSISVGAWSRVSIGRASLLGKASNGLVISNSSAWVEKVMSIRLPRNRMAEGFFMTWIILSKINVSKVEVRI